MKHLKHTLLLFSSLLLLHCSDDDDGNVDIIIDPVNTEVNFQYKTTINVGGEASAEISAFDASTNKLFVTNAELNEISVYNISDLDVPVQESSISLNAFGAPNSVAVLDGKLAVAVEASTKQNPGQIHVYNTSDLSLDNQYTVGALPDMVTFSKDGNYILSANEGEPNDDYTIDPMGTVSIIDLNDDTVTTLDFSTFTSQEANLTSQGFRVFGPNATLVEDVEPEYIAISDDSQTAWVSLQENNGIAKINLITKVIEAIYPLGYKDYNLAQNSIDASDKDEVTELKNWPVKGIYMPDAIVSVNINGTDYVISANEGDSRDYDGFSEEERLKDLTLDPTVFPATLDYLADENLGRLKTTTTLGDIDNDGDIDEIYSYGARSFSIWNANGSQVYDSGNDIATQILANTPSRFNWDWEDNENDKRSDDKGAEPESVTVLNIADQRYILFVGLERNCQVMVYDITNPAAPTFLSILSHDGDYAPEGLLVVPAADSPTGKDLLIVSNEDSGTVSFYENQQ
ncbi:choice-of-anchor I family protein [Olleya sp. YSTF-M6]|uniref:Choice-of-anchor I family protein n=1 Tax=Olleya sediminilitoris TaxID=2795739 RepID=A0ABS1WJD7_9FLAO|nr:choice-of-anchor I family protein [Olleya sediminilitoris]MBL7559244.1 choice-of-anchor I family protein [Olleya sediminilitoris]